MSLLINPARFFAKTEPSEGTGAIVIDLQVLAEAQNHLSDIDAAGELPLWVRRELMTNLGRRLGDDLTAFAFVAMLGLICARHAWPVWQCTFVAESTAVPTAYEAAVGLARRDQEADSG